MMNAVKKVEISQPDFLAGKWILAIYIGTFVPYVALAVVIASSVLYYAWRNKRPSTARAINRHAWTAFGLAMVIHVLVQVQHVFIR
jgi:hypothetical protein